jgi:S1-C subfamily serine protease
MRPAFDGAAAGHMLGVINREVPMADTLQALSTDLATLASSASPRIVSVTAADGSVASGLIWRSGLVVSAHEALGEEEFTIGFSDGTSATAELLGRDPSTDVALFKVKTADFEDWRQSATPAPGSLAVVAGRGEHSVVTGLAVVSEVGPAWRSMRGGEIDARIALGVRLSHRTEGGAVLSPDGGLIGLAVTGIRRQALVIPASTVARAVDTLAARGYVPRGFLGVSLHPAGGDGGAIVVGLEPKGPAASAGFLVGDIITTWSGDPVTSVAGITDRLSAESVGKVVQLGVIRGGSPRHIDLTIGERPRA